MPRDRRRFVLLAFLFPAAADTRALTARTSGRGPSRSASGRGTWAATCTPFTDGGATGNAAVRIDDGSDDDFDTVSARARPIDDVLGAPDGPVSVIKIDVEGHEDLALRGAAQLVERCRPTVFIEWNPIYYERRGVEPTTVIDALLDRWGYRCLRRVDGRWTEQPSFWSPYDLDNLVLGPADRIDEMLGRLQAAASGMVGVTG